MKARAAGGFLSQGGVQPGGGDGNLLSPLHPQHTAPMPRVGKVETSGWQHNREKRQKRKKKIIIMLIVTCHLVQQRLPVNAFLPGLESG